MTDPASFLSRAGYTCDTWTALPWNYRVAEAATFIMHGQTRREGATDIAVYADEWTPAEYGRRIRDGAQYATQVDAYCLRAAVQKQGRTVGRVATRLVRPAGDPIASAPSSGSGWKLVAVIFGSLAVWELLQYSKHRALTRRGIR